MTDPITFLHGDCIERMRELDAESIDAVVTDPPYGLEFMGKEWDRLRAVAEDPASIGGFQDGNGGNAYSRSRVRYATGAGMQAWHEAWATEAFRVAKPGAHLLAFGGPRTYHRLACAIEDAGWEIRDCLVWAYASGFPKSLDVSKAIDKAAGAERAVVGVKHAEKYPNGPGGNSFTVAEGPDGTRIGPQPLTAPATDAARQWDGWGTALKPAWEPIVMARKPLRGTVAANVTAWGTGALNIGATRIPFRDPLDAAAAAAVGHMHALSRGSHVQSVSIGKESRDGTEQYDASRGRWPANVVLTDPIFDGGIEGVVGGGETTSGAFPGAGYERAGDSIYGPATTSGGARSLSDSGTYSRFFLIPKSARAERERGLRGRERDPLPNYQPTVLVCECGERWKPPENGGLLKCNHPREMAHYEAAPRDPTRRANVHPTVKPIDLMRHLVRLVTPPGGLILDPFVGSGTTALAASEEGFRCLGIDQSAEYLEIAKGRLNATAIGMGLDHQLIGKRRKVGSNDPGAVARRGRKPHNVPGWGFKSGTPAQEEPA